MKQYANLLFCKKIDFFKIASLINIAILIFGTAFLILNSTFPMFENVAKSNWIIGLLIASSLFLFSVISNYDDYKGNCYPKFYQVWIIILYPALFFGLTLSLIYINCVSTASQGHLLNWCLGLTFALTLFIESYLDSKYDDLDEILYCREVY